MIRAMIAVLLAPWLSAEAEPERPMMPNWWLPEAGSDWIPLTTLEDRPHLVIPVTINGQAAWALVDTGVEGMGIDRHYAEAHGMTLRPGFRAESFGGPTTSYFASGVSMTIGAVRTQAPSTFVTFDLSGVASEAGHPIDAIIGMGLLGHVSWEVDEDGRRMRLLPTGRLPMSHPAPLRFGPNGTRMITDVVLAAAGSQAAAVDTGSDNDLLLDTELAQRAGVRTVTDVGELGFGGAFAEWLGRLPAVTVAGTPVANAEVRVNDQVRSTLGQHAMLGMGLLRRYNLRVDLPAGKLELDSRLTVVQPAAKSTSGVQGLVVDGRLTISHVMLNSPAQASGLKAGDAICAVNDWTATQADARHWGRAAPGTRYAVHLCDGRTVALVTRAFY